MKSAEEKYASRRTREISFMVTEEEYANIQAAAQAAAVVRNYAPVNKWAREIVLEAAKPTTPLPMLPVEP